MSFVKSSGLLSPRYPEPALPQLHNPRGSSLRVLDKELQGVVGGLACVCTRAEFLREG